MVDLAYAIWYNLRVLKEQHYLLNIRRCRDMAKRTLEQAYDICRKKFYLHMDKMNGQLFEFRGSKNGDYYTGPRGDEMTNRWV